MRDRVLCTLMTHENVARVHSFAHFHFCVENLVRLDTVTRRVRVRDPTACVVCRVLSWVFGVKAPETRGGDVTSSQ